MAEARVDGEDEGKPVEAGDRESDRKNGEVLAEMDVDEVGPCGGRLREKERRNAIELAKTADGNADTNEAGALAEALEPRRARPRRGHDGLGDAAPVEDAGQLGGVVLQPADGVEGPPPPFERRRGRLEDRAEP